mgnify:CR=1
MNIKNRIQKLEGDLFEDANSDVCNCPGERGCSVLMPDLDKSDADREHERAEWLKPIYCEICGKSIERQRIEISYVDGGG